MLDNCAAQLAARAIVSNRLNVTPLVQVTPFAGTVSQEAKPKVIGAQFVAQASRDLRMPIEQ